MKHFLKALALATLAAAAVPAALAGPITINFSGFTTTSNLTSYTQSGYTFTSSGSGVYGNYYQGDPAPGISATVTASSTQTFNMAPAAGTAPDFSLTSFNIGANTNNAGPIKYTVQGYLNGVLEWTYTGTQAGNQASCVVVASGCYNLISLPGIDDVNVNKLVFSTIGQGSAGTLFYDNVTLNPSPEPSSLILLGTGLFGAGVLIYRRKKGSLNVTGLAPTIA